MQTREIKLGNLIEKHITIPEDFFSLANLLKVLSELEDQNLSIVKIIFFGKKLSKDFLDLSKKYPMLFLGDRKNLENSVYIYVIQPKKEISNFKLEYIKDNKENILGTFLQVANDKFLFKTNKNILEESKSFSEQLVLEYDFVGSLLKKYEFSWKNIFRFWNYTPDIIGYYPEFNEIRNSFFEKNNVQIYPAATGIQAFLKNDEKVFIGFEGIGSEQIKVNKISSEIQSEASYYGPKFSRGMTLIFPDNSKKIYISGTSTVGKVGETLFQENLSENIKYTFNSVKHLLEKESLSLENIVTAIVYCKTQEMEDVFCDFYKKEKYNFPYTKLRVDICRDNFLFEVECIAAK